MKTETEVLVVGLGPVGLFLTYLLGMKGIKVIAVDKRLVSSSYSRSIGIHPPLLDYFKQIGLLDDFLDRGIKISKTSIHFNNRKSFSVDLANLVTNAKYVLSIPQYETEKILERKVLALDNVNLRRGDELTSAEQNDLNIEAKFINGKSVIAKFLIGCDGIKSQTRKLLKIDFKGQDYPDFYGMADFYDESDISKEASIYLHGDGLLESFPLSTFSRRWVARIGSHEKQNFKLSDLTKLIERRSGLSFKKFKCIQDVSTFTAQSYDATDYFKNRAVLLGDSAHVVSPIGGQGMNLGWLGAIKLVERIRECISSEESHEEVFLSYQQEQKRLANIVSKRAEFNMSFGRPSIALNLRIYMLKLMYVFSRVKFVESFTMGNLK